MPHFSAFAAETPDRPAYIMANSGEVVTYAELDRRSNQVAHLLRASGVNRGDHIAIMMKNCTEFLQVAQGALRAGIIFTPISTHLKQDETAYIITNCKAKLFVASASLAEVATEAAAASAAVVARARAAMPSTQAISISSLMVVAPTSRAPRKINGKHNTLFTWFG